MYANNIEIIGKSGEEIEGGVTELVNVGKGFGLIINNEKTKYLMVARGGDHNNLRIGNNIFEQVQSSNTSVLL